MKKHVYIFSNASIDNHKKITEHWKWDCISKWQKIRKVVWNIWTEVIGIIASSEPKVIQTADFIADWMQLRNYNMQIYHDLANDSEFETNIDEIIESIKNKIKKNVLTIIILHKKNINKIKEKLCINWECVNEPSMLWWFHFTIEWNN